ncbi:hypothetical protein FGK63_04015 [Ruegeria sediminis]|uniref:DUF306 domain-containing protein n=1 Tax=Ruegeria sediminis TaxID=2583820 RepID=A0ABY2X4B6_9RHOB|nr:hypothetical protein [Ruegeria sediminis]TMV10237.1 hypothetical protein FGK63_04015 [Ruegeria sediminis]
MDILDERQFRETVVGRKLAMGGTWIVVSDDGKISGTGENGDEIAGTWSWDGAYFRRIVSYGRDTQPEDLQKVVANGDQITFVRQKGDGVAFTFTFAD